MKYGFESIIANEFHTINADCATLVPQGAGYENVSLANQVCTTVGSVSGQAFVDGNRFIEISYNYSFDHVWRNFGIVIAFLFGLIGLLLLATEFNTADRTTSTVTLFKRGTKQAAVNSKSESQDVEKGLELDRLSRSTGLDHSERTSEQDLKIKKALQSSSGTTDIFSWKNLNYVVPIAGGQHRKLLDNVSGFVAPGKLTALMGESGAGKVRYLASFNVDGGANVRLDNALERFSRSCRCRCHHW